jgi:glutamine amidotransferase
LPPQPIVSMRSFESIDTEIVIIDYGVGNVGAIQNMLEFLGVESRISDCTKDIQGAGKIILPGVGAFDAAMNLLNQKDMVGPLTNAALVERIPILGICLGMQLLAKNSEEGVKPGLGWLDSEVKKMQVAAESRLKIPHIGWAEIEIAHTSDLLVQDDSVQRFYFDHSYHMVCNSEEIVTATFAYDGDRCCAVQDKNVYGVQFHPEKSHRFGLQLLKNFAALPVRGQA